LTGRASLATALGLLAIALTAPNAVGAPTDAPLLIRQLDVQNEYVMLQMTTAGQQGMAGETLDIYGADGALARSAPLSGSLPNGESQRGILISNESSSVAAAADFVLADMDALDPDGGAVCIHGVYPADCVAWGVFPSIQTPTGASLPDPQSLNAGIGPGNMPFPIATLTRLIAFGCSTWLDPPDDSGSSRQDFSFGEPIGPRGNSAAPGEVPCVPETLFNETPANPTNDTTPTFAFGEVPDAYDATFECSFGGAPFSPCLRSGNTYGPLADGVYNFKAFSTTQVAGNTDLTPASWTFEVDTQPPDTSVTQTPPPVSSGFSATFSFASSEHHPTFVCRLDSGPKQTCEPGKTYFFLADGHHTFRVWSSDQATNQDPSPAEHVFLVDTSFGDTLPPFTAITSGPPKHTRLTSASFTYSANEPGSRFECKVDDGEFSACDATGKRYPGLRNGRHVFQARAIDRAGNADTTPDPYVWTIEGTSPETKITKAPPGIRRLGVGHRSTQVRFAFSSSRPGSDFACRIDGQPFHPCESPEKLSVGLGRHRFEVYATDQLGNRDASPARRIFRVLRKGASKGIFGRPQPKMEGR
jgi:hypothetical protein